MEPELGPMRTSFGAVLVGDGKGNFRAVPATRSGFVVPGQARDIQRVRTARGYVYIVARNDDRPLVFRSTASASSF
jgi:enediyne biosynthesis protein E4